jgi:hypothetical protein
MDSTEVGDSFKVIGDLGETLMVDTPAAHVLSLLTMKRLYFSPGKKLRWFVSSLYG